MSSKNFSAFGTKFDAAPAPAQGCDVAERKSGHRVYVHLSYGLDVIEYAELHARGLAPDQSPYGFHLAANHGYELLFSRDRRVGRVANLIARAIKRMLGFDPLHAWHNRESITRADIVWTMLEVEALAVASLMWLRLVPRRPMLGSTVWMINSWDRTGFARRWLYRRLIPFFSELLVHSELCRKRAVEIFPEARVKLMKFGVPAETYYRVANDQPEQEVIQIVAAGNDHTRDWQVLLDAFGNDPRFHLTIICQWFDRAYLARYSNLNVPQNVTMGDYHELYRDATYLAVPMHANIFSGITAALEASAMGVPILSTRTGGVPTYFDDDEVGFIEVGDAAGWRDAALGRDARARAAMVEKAQARFLRDDYSTAGMMARYAAETELLLAPR